MIFLALISGATALLSGLAWRGRHDRAPGTTLWLWGGAAALSVLPLVTLGTLIGGPADDWAVWAWAVLMLIYFPVAALFLEHRQRRDRHARRQLAIASGMPEAEARTRYRRSPRSPWTILVTYLWLTYVWIFGAVVLGLLIPRTQDWLMADAITLPAAAPGESPYPLPWLMAGIGLTVLGGMAHAGINGIRR